MKKNIYMVLLLFMVLLTATACGILQEPAEPSATIEAVPLEIEESEESAAVEVPTEAAEEPPVELDEAEETETMEEEAVAEETTDETAVAGLVVYEISQGDSEVRFELDEDLRGVRTTVVGMTDQVAGQIALDFSDLATAQVGEIQINLLPNNCPTDAFKKFINGNNAQTLVIVGDLR